MTPLQKHTTLHDYKCDLSQFSLRAGIHNISVFVNSVDIGAVALTVVQAPSIVAVSPTISLITGNVNVVLSATELQAEQPVFCHFDSIKVLGTLLPSSMVSCIAPSVESPRVVQLSLSSDGTNVGNDVVFVFTTFLHIFHVHPVFGQSAGGTHVSLHVAGLNATLVPLDCMFGQILVKTIVVRSDIISCISPPSVATTVGLAVAVAGEAVSNIVEFAYHDEVVIVAISTDFVPGSGGKE
jgi:hypothetical protein